MRTRCIDAYALRLERTTDFLPLPPHRHGGDARLHILPRSAALRDSWSKYTGDGGRRVQGTTSGCAAFAPVALYPRWRAIPRWDKGRSG